MNLIPFNCCHSLHTFKSSSTGKSKSRKPRSAKKSNLLWLLCETQYKRLFNYLLLETVCTSKTSDGIEIKK